MSISVFRSLSLPLPHSIPLPPVIWCLFHNRMIFFPGCVQVYVHVLKYYPRKFTKRLVGLRGTLPNKGSYLVSNPCETPLNGWTIPQHNSSLLPQPNTPIHEQKKKKRLYILPPSLPQWNDTALCPSSLPFLCPPPPQKKKGGGEGAAILRT